MILVVAPLLALWSSVSPPSSPSTVSWLLLRASPKQVVDRVRVQQSAPVHEHREGYFAVDGGHAAFIAGSRTAASVAEAVLVGRFYVKNFSEMYFLIAHHTKKLFHHTKYPNFDPSSLATIGTWEAETW